MFKINRKVQTIAPSGIREFFDLVLEMEEVISLGVGEPDFSTPWNICEYSIFGLEKGYTSYTSNKGLEELRKEISNYLVDRYNLSYDFDSEILITTGVSEGFDLAIRSIVEKGDKVLIPTPSYVSYIPLTQLAGGNPITVPTDPKNDFKVTSQQIERVCREEDVKIFVFNYPCNPTGASYTSEELEKIAQVIKKYDLLVISDEIYSRLSYNFKHTPFPTLLDMKERTIYLNGFSKAYAMTGWRIGYSCGPERVIAAMTKIHQYTMLSSPIMSQMAAIEALKHSDNSVEYMLKKYRRRKRFLVKRFNEIGLECSDPQGTFYLFPDISNYYENSVDFAKDLVKDQKVAVVPGVAFGPGGENYIRVSYASNLIQLKEAANRIEKFLTSLKE